MSSIENLPPGRERAIETLIDMEPLGPFYRASRALEESVPQALSQRPNLITKAALVDQAHALSRYEIDTLAKYDALYGMPPSASAHRNWQEDSKKITPSRKHLLLKHYSKIQAAKQSALPSSSSTSSSYRRPSPQLVAALRRLYEGEDSIECFALLQTVGQAMIEKESDNQNSSDGSSNQSSAISSNSKNTNMNTIEALIANLLEAEECKEEDSADYLQRLMVALLSIVANYNIAIPSTGNITSSSTLSEELPSSPSSLQVGSILSVVRPKEMEEALANSWALDTEVLDYFGEAAIIYEERLALQKAALLSKLDENRPIKATLFQTPPSTERTIETTAAAVVEEEEENSGAVENYHGTSSGGNYYATGCTFSDEPSTLSDAVMESIIDEFKESSDEEEGDSSSSDSESELNFSPGDEEMSSSSSSSVSRGDGGDTNPQGQSDDEGVNENEQETDMEDLVLREALALSISSDAPNPSSQFAEAIASPIASPGPITPGTETPSANYDFSMNRESEAEDIPLPVIPLPPKTYPYNIGGDSPDSVSEEINFYDPASTNCFGRLPTAHVFVHLFHCTLQQIEALKFSNSEKENATNFETTVPGGMGSALFPPNHQNPEKVGKSPHGKLGGSFQMLVSLVLLVYEVRQNSMLHFEHAMRQEKKDTKDDRSKNQDMGVSSSEGDDPALALALHYMDEQTESKESLEAKGMHRKAAAAALDAEALRKSLQRKTKEWKEQLDVFSYCTLLSLKCLQTFMQSITRHWLLDQDGSSAFDYSALLPKSMKSKLADLLDSFMCTPSIQNHDSHFSNRGLSLKLYQHAVHLWGELIPILYPDLTIQKRMLRDMIQICSSVAIDLPLCSLEKMSAVSFSDLQCQIHKLHVMCRRLRVTDHLARFVSSPLSYSTPNDKSSDVHQRNLYEYPEKATTLISLMSSSKDFLHHKTGEPKNLYLALCHRMHSCSLMWDGLYSCADSKSTDSLISGMTSSSDTVQIGKSPSDSLLFDGTKCSDSMAIIGNEDVGKGYAVNQRASKVWGTVLSSTSFLPKTGIHRWAVRLDKCERGHIFIGVSTSQASMRTYVGGDKHGWGMIGTQALWHDRRKIKGDYGATFRTGSTIIVTLDTDAGTLGFSSWRSIASSPSSFSLESVPGSQNSNSQVSGKADDWGIAFEGLPLDARLFPAVGLYQRDDRVSLLAVENKVSPDEKAVSGFGGCVSYYPLEPSTNMYKSHSTAVHVRQFNDLISWDGIAYCKNLLENLPSDLHNNDHQGLLSSVFPALASSMCLIPPKIPILSKRFALALLPSIRTTLLNIEREVAQIDCLSVPAKSISEGVWTIRATGSMSADSEEYRVELGIVKDGAGNIIGFKGSGVGTTGKSRNGLVTIHGCMRGTALGFVENWTDQEAFGSFSSDDSSSCVVSARLNVGGTKFEGSYRNTQFGNVGQIAGFLEEDSGSMSQRLFSETQKQEQDRMHEGRISTTKMLLCLAHAHLSAVLIEDSTQASLSSGPSLFDKYSLNEKEYDSIISKIQQCLTIPLLSSSHRSVDATELNEILSEMRKTYAPKEETQKSDQYAFLPESFLAPILTERLNESQKEDILAIVVQQDETVCRSAGIKSSFAPLSNAEYVAARRHVVATLLHFCRDVETVDFSLNFETSPVFEVIWRKAHMIIESGIRAALSSTNSKTSLKERAKTKYILYQETSEFLLSLRGNTSLNVDAIGYEVARIYELVNSNAHLHALKKKVESANWHGILRYIALKGTSLMLKRFENHFSLVEVEALATSIPKLLGRGYLTGRGLVDDSIDLSGHYLCNLPGVSKNVFIGLQSEAHLLFDTLGGILSKLISLSRTQSADPLNIHSLTLVVTASLTTSMKKSDLRFWARESNILSAILSTFNAYFKDAMKKLSAQNAESRDYVKEIHDIGQREMLRLVVRSLLGLSHVVIYQTLVHSDRDDLETFLDFLFKLLRFNMPLIAEQNTLASTSLGVKMEDEQWQRWLRKASNVSEQKPPKQQNVDASAERSGVTYFLQYGFGDVTLAQNLPQQTSSNSRIPPTSRSKFRKNEAHTFIRNHFADQVLTHFLHAIVAGSKNEVCCSLMQKKNGWLKFLFGFVGLDVTERIGKNYVPVRYRVRIMRALWRYLSSQEPCEILVSNLFYLAGSTNILSSKTLHEDESELSREAVTLLRRFHAPTQKSWRTLVNKVIETKSLDQANDFVSYCCKMGVILFFNGGMDGVKESGFVVLKPSNAASLSSDHQGGTNSSKSTNSGTPSSSMPHHMIGNGTAGILAGLARESASAGIISSIDSKNGVCEIVLLRRSMNTDENQTIRRKVRSGTGTGSSDARLTLTVRAIRSPLMDIALSQEVGLYLDKDVISTQALIHLLESAINHLETCSKGKERLKDKSNESKNMTFEDIQEYLLDTSYSVMVFKGVISVITERGILAQLVRDERCRGIFGALVRLSYTERAASNSSDEYTTFEENPFLSAIPLHEARWKHLLVIFRGLAYREKMLDNVGPSEWAARFSQYQLNTIKRKEALVLDGLSEEDATNVLSTNHTEKKSTFSSNPPRNEGGSSLINGDTVNSSTGDRALSQSSISNMDNSEEEEEEEEENTAMSTAAAHLREVAVAQMAELGLPRSWSELALRRTGGNNIEAAVHFCLERGGDMERLLQEERERERAFDRSTSMRRRSNRRDDTSHLLSQLTEMGFPSRWCAEALTATGNNVDEALTWILSNGERLSAEDTGMNEDEEGDDDEDYSGNDDDDDDDSQEDGQENDKTNIADRKESPEALDKKPPNLRNPSDLPTWTSTVVPLRFVSGRSIIDAETLSISGLPSGGFSSVGTKGILLTTGKWYYEAVLETAGCLQVGWADGSFAGHCHADRGDGCGDGPSSWAYDGWRRYRWHSTATEWGCRWKEGDVVGCMVDMDERTVSFTLNGRAEEIGMGLAFSDEGFRPCSGVYACVSFNRREKLRMILGGQGSEPFQYSPPSGYCGVGEAVVRAAEERKMLITKEMILETDLSRGGMDSSENKEDGDKLLCDFSDGEHGHELMAWAHRYYGSDASVHLGSGRNKSSTPQKGMSSYSSSHLSETECLDRRMENSWSLADDFCLQKDAVLDSASFLAQIKQGYFRALGKVREETIMECSALASLYARKLLLHIMVVQGRKFDVTMCLQSDASTTKSAVRFWKMIESCGSLRLAGWVGEAGAMAIAAEALGLGISSNDNISTRKSSKPGIQSPSLYDLDDGKFIPSPGSTQVLCSVFEQEIVEEKFLPLSRSNAACAEASFGSDNGTGVLLFLRPSLEAALSCSRPLLNASLASIRRSIRILSAVEYDGEDSSASDDLKNNDLGTTKSRASNSMPQFDARFISYVTGLLLSPQMHTLVEDPKNVQGELFEAWSVGLLSASLPWRMICAFTASGILNLHPGALLNVVTEYPTLSWYYARLMSTVARGVWAERAASPVCSRYTQALLELLCSVKRAVKCLRLPKDFTSMWKRVSVDAATPIPQCNASSIRHHWEADAGWLSCEIGCEIWTGSIKFIPVDWKAPTRSAVRTLMDGGDGPPMLREGCFVMRSPDWSSNDKCNDEDGTGLYETEKARKCAEKRLLRRQANEDDINSMVGTESSSNPVDEDSSAKTQPNARKKKMPSPKLPLGTVTSIEAWNGVPGTARRVRWHLTGEEGIYRYGGDGGHYDISHVEVNEKATRVRKRHPFPESTEQCVSRHGFGIEKQYNVLLRIQSVSSVAGSKIVKRKGILEWPDFGAGISVDFFENSNGTFTLREGDLLYGSKDSGWEARFGHPYYVPGTEVILKPTMDDSHSKSADSIKDMSIYEEVTGSHTYSVPYLRDRATCKSVDLTSKWKFVHSRLERTSKAVGSSPLPPITFDRECHASSLSLSKDGKTVSCTSSEGRGTAFASIGFTKGIHYWEVKLEQADIGSVFIGVAEKPSPTSSGVPLGHDQPAQMNKWHGWGFVNFRATYAFGVERIYGAHCHSGDTVGVLLDCDSGRLSFFFDGLKYGEHILNDLGCAFENLSPFGFNVDGCGSGGAGQGAPSGMGGGRSGQYSVQGAVRPKTLWPVVGLRNQGDRVTLSQKWSTSYGSDGISCVENILAFDEIIGVYDMPSTPEFPDWFISEAFDEYQRWKSGTCDRSVTRGSGPFELPGCGLDIELDTSLLACAAASASLGMEHALLPGTRVKLKRSAGRILELAEEAIVLGAYQGRLYYRIVSQKSEGGSLNEGGGRAWFWDESEVVDGLDILSKNSFLDIPLPVLSRFRCPASGGLKVVYEGGAVVRSDLEIFDGSTNLGSIPVGTILRPKDIMERRVNSCGVVRYRVRYNGIEGWISSRIRVGEEEYIVHQIEEKIHEHSSVDAEHMYRTPLKCALKWLEDYRIKNSSLSATYARNEKIDIGSFKDLLCQGILKDMPMANSDAFLSATLGKMCNMSDAGNPLHIQYTDLKTSLSFAIAINSGETLHERGGSAAMNQTAAAAFLSVKHTIPPLEALMVRCALLRAFNRRARIALPWLSLKPTQEGSALFGGIYGHGASVERSGRSIDASLRDEWVQIPTIASKIRKNRGIFFMAVKQEFINSITNVTTTPTPLSHDEYELPREIRTVRLNRLKARRVMNDGSKFAKRKHSVFAQLNKEARNWGGAALRRGFVAKGHGGQKRAFKVKLIGEGVNDYSGPYREAFTDLFAEVLDVDENGHGSLGVLDCTPNNVTQIGENQSMFMFSSNGTDVSKLFRSSGIKSNDEEKLSHSFSSLMLAREEGVREVEDSLLLLGKVTGTAFRHGIAVDLPLPLESVWKAITEEESDDESRLKEIDVLSFRHRNKSQSSFALLSWQRRMLNSFVEGLSTVLPMEIMTLLSGVELKEILCGSPDIDVDLLKRIVEYEGYIESDEVVLFFWETLRELTNEERRSFLQFVWARNRLPAKESDFDAPFKIVRDSSNKNGEKALPSASTCFFSLLLPEYTSKEILKKKLLFAINNVATMETDFQTNSTEIAEGYKAF